MNHPVIRILSLSQAVGLLLLLCISLAAQYRQRPRAVVPQRTYPVHYQPYQQGQYQQIPQRQQTYQQGQYQQGQYQQIPQRQQPNSWPDGQATQPAADATPAQASTAEDGRQASQTSFDPAVLELAEGEVDFRRDWWKYSLMFLSASLGLLVILLIAKQLASMAIVVVSLLASALIAYLGGPMLDPWLRDAIPALKLGRCPTVVWSYLVIFLLVFLMDMLIVKFVKRPVKAKEDH